MASEMPRAVLFACSHNAVRSPMAEALMKRFHGHAVFVDSVGVHHGEIDPFVVEAMAEKGIDLSRHRAKTFDELADGSFDLIVSLSPEAHHRAVEMTRAMACDVEYWPTQDATAIEGAREQRLDAYRAVRNYVEERIRQRFPPETAPKV